jgi:putative tryptophan/tyrosine transport system substrate-binding protein
MQRRDFIKAVAGSAMTWPLVVRAQQAMPVIAFFRTGSADANARFVTAFRKGLGEEGFVEGQNVTIEYHWLVEGPEEQLPTLMTDLVRRRVAVIVTPGTSRVALAAKAATTTIPIVFGEGTDPVGLGLVPSLARPGGNLTGVNYFVDEVVSKRLRLLHDLVPKAVRIAVLVNPANASTAKSTLQAVQQAASAIGLQTQIVQAATIGEIDAVFAGFEHEHPDALFVAPDAFFASRRGQFATLTARDRIPSAYAIRELVEAGGLMSYGTDIAEAFRQVGIYTGRVLKGEKPADLPVLQSTKFEFVINQQTARALGIEIPNSLLLLADEVIE